MASNLYIGIMSGTSTDGADAVLCECSPQALRYIASASIPFTDSFRKIILELNQDGPQELHRAQLAANALVESYYAPLVRALLKDNACLPGNIIAIGTHGQTVRHQPKKYDAWGYTIQINQPALLQNLTGIDVVADFRSTDLYAHGQAAPLIPAFHRALHDYFPQANMFCNIGGMSNITVIDADNLFGFDCGPGNVLMDVWIEQHLQKKYDANGAWARSGVLRTDILAYWQQHDYFLQAFPKSTGREVFNLAFIQQALGHFINVCPEDVACTLTHLSAWSIAQALKAVPTQQTTLQIFGGGAFNGFLLEVLSVYLPDIEIQTTQALGIHPQNMEAMAFAWLAYMRINAQAIDLQTVTGAHYPCILGAVYTGTQKPNTGIASSLYTRHENE